MHDKLSNGRSYKMLTVLDEFTRRALAVTVRTRMGADDVLEALYPLLLRHGSPEYIRSDKGTEFIAEAVRNWIKAVGAKTAFSEAGSPQQNAFIESFNGSLRDEILNEEMFNSLEDARRKLALWLRQYNHTRRHQALNMRPPVPETLLEKPLISGPGTGTGTGG